MVSPELTPIQQAYKEIPKRWFERDETFYQVVKFVSIPATLAYGGLILSGNDSLPYHLIGAGIFIASAVADRITTSRCLDSINRAVANNIPVDHEEANPQFPSVTTSREFNFHPKILLIDIIGTTSSLILPSLATTWGIPKFIASLSNLRVAKRYNRATQIASFAGLENNPE